MSSKIIKNTQSNISKVNILYEGNPIDTLTMSKVIFWNKSFPTINDSDIIEKAPLSIYIKNGEILEACVLKGHNTSNNISVHYKDNNVFINFDYLDRKEGGIIQIFHTGEENDIDVTRKIKGGRVILCQENKSDLEKSKKTLLLGTFAFSLNALCNIIELLEINILDFEDLIQIGFSIKKDSIFVSTFSLVDALGFSSFIIILISIIGIFKNLITGNIPQNCKDDSSIKYFK